MKKIITKPVIAVAFLVGVMGVSSFPLSANAYSQHNNSNNSSWNRNDNRWNNHSRVVSDWEARETARRFIPNRHIVHEEDHWDNAGRHEHRFRFDDNHCVDVRDDGVVVRIFVIIDR